jgi:uncharacterized protein YvpB
MKIFFAKLFMAIGFLTAAAGITFFVLIMKDSYFGSKVVLAQAEQITSISEQSVNTELPETVAEETIVETSGTESITLVQTEQTSKNITTSRERRDFDSKSVYIDMENILQNPELPTGCEITSLTILLRYYGFDAEKTDMAKNYLPTSWGNPRYIDGEVYKDSFFDYFIGDPFGTGYGCFSNAIEKAANDYIADNGGGYTVLNISGSSPQDLYSYLADGVPVICWATDGMIEPEYYESWYDNATGEKLDWYLNEHCFVLVGFDMEKNTVTLNDPMKGIIDYNMAKFEKRYEQMYSQAIIIQKDENNYNTE